MTCRSTLLAAPSFEPSTGKVPCGYRKSSMYAGRRNESEKSWSIECEESRIRRTFVFAPALACRSCRSSGRAGLAIRKASSQATAVRCRAAKPESPWDLLGSRMGNS